MLISWMLSWETKVEPVHFYYAFHTRSGNDKTNMTDNGKTKRTCSSFVLSYGCRTGEGEAAEVACRLPTSPTRGGKALGP